MKEVQIPLTVTAINNAVTTLDQHNKCVYAESVEGTRHIAHNARQEDDTIVVDTPVGQKTIRNAWYIQQ